MSFVLPHEFTLSTVPQPNDKRILLREKQTQLVAAIRYSGINTVEKINEHVSELNEWLIKNHSYRPVDEPQCAQYDAPMTVPFLRKNEILVDIKKMN